MVSVAIFGDAPTLTTGFARTTGRMARSIADTGVAVDVFGMKATPEDLVGSPPAYRIWPAELDGHWTAALPGFFAAADPAVLIMNMDAYNAVECIAACEAAGWSGPTVSYVCFDGLPARDEIFAAQRRCAAVWATTRAGRSHLESNGVEVAGVAPSGVDGDLFRPDPRRRRLRRKAGFGDAAVVGVFGTNTERKQLLRAVDAFAAAAERLPERDLRLYMHCAKSGYWDLEGRVAELGLTQVVTIAGESAFDERRGVESPSYVDCLNYCDVIVNLAHSGDVEQVILEAQACGVPLVHTADDGVMSEALGDGGIALAAATVEYGRMGEQRQLVDPATAADAIVRVLTNSALATELRAAGKENVARYGWERLEAAACLMVEPFTT